MLRSTRISLLLLLAALIACPGVALSEEKEESDALSATARATAEGPGENPHFLNGLKMRSNPRSALEHFSHSIRICPNHALSYYHRGACFVELRNYESAIKDLDRAIKLDATPDAYLQRGLALSLSGEPKKALADLTEALALNVEDDVTAYRARARVLRDMKRDTEAIADWERAIEGDTRDYRSLIERGKAYGRLGNDAAAQADFARAISRLSSLTNASWGKDLLAKGYSMMDVLILDRRMRARIYLERGGLYYYYRQDPYAALADYFQAIHLYPNDPEAHNARGLVYLALGENVRALADFNEALIHSLHAPGAVENTGLAYLRMGHTDKAIEVCLEALEADPGLEWSRAILAIAYTVKGDSKSARAHWRKYRSRRPSDGFLDRYFPEAQWQAIIEKHR